MVRFGVLCAALAALTLTLGTSVSSGQEAGRLGAALDSRAGSCPRGAKPAVIAGDFKCLRGGQRCKTRYQAAYKRYGFVCVAGYLHKRRPAPPPTPPPAEPPPPLPPTPLALPGHYKGLTSQMTTFEFDVIATGAGVTNLVTGQVNQGCTPQFNLSGGAINLGTYVMPIGGDGTFGVSFSTNGTIGTVAATGAVSITGHFSGPTAVGNLERKTFFTWTNGVAYACGSGLQTWTVTRTQ